MKKIFLFVCCFFTTISLMSASEASLFTFDNSLITEEFASIDQLDNELDLQKANNQTNNLSLFSTQTLQNINTCTASAILFHGDIFDDMDWGAFAWGMCCCPVGFFVVAISDEKSNNSKKSYWIGVLISTVISLISSALAPSTSYSY